MRARLVESAFAILLSTSLLTAPTYAGAPQESQSGAHGQTQPAPAQQTLAPAPQSDTQQGAAPQASADQARSLKLLQGPDYSKGPRFLPNFTSPFFPIKVAAPMLTNSSRIDQLIQDGKLSLSLDDAIALALENNLDIGVQRFTPWIAQTDVLRTKSGGAARGIGGTGTASALGNIASASFDPVLQANVNWSRTTTPVNNAFQSGTGTTAVPLVSSHAANYNFTYSQGFHTGTAISVGWDNTRSSTSIAGDLFNPAVQSTMVFGLQQQLLNGFGLLPNTRFILEAKNTLKVANLGFQLQVITSVSQVENAYWELVFARENVRVQEAALTTSTKLYNDNKRQVEIGTLAPLEVVRAESQVATDRENLIVAQTNQLQQQTALMNLITKNPLSASLQNVEIVPTTPIGAPPPEQLAPIEQAVNDAWQHRAEIQQAELNLKNAGIEVRATRNALLPTATLFAQYSATGLGGIQHKTTVTPNVFTADLTAPIVDRNGTPIANEFLSIPVTTTTVTPGGFGDALQAEADRRFPSYVAGINFTLPIRNRSAQADSARALLDERQLETQYRQLQNTVVVDVRNAQIFLQQDQARVDAAEKARVLAQQTLDAEQKKYQLGASTSFLVIQSQRDLTTAQGNEIRAKVDLIEAEVAFQKAMGRTLDANHITMADARGGRVYNPPLIPGTPEVVLTGGNK